MKYVTDDGKKTFDTAEECQAFEEAQKIEGVIDAQIWEYLEQCTTDEIHEDGTVKKVGLSSRVWTRKENDILDWIRWDRQQRPNRYFSEEEMDEVDEQAVAVIQGRA